MSIYRRRSACHHVTLFKSSLYPTPKNPKLFLIQMAPRLGRGPPALPLLVISFNWSIKLMLIKHLFTSFNNWVSSRIVLPTQDLFRLSDPLIYFLFYLHQLLTQKISIFPKLTFTYNIICFYSAMAGNRSNYHVLHNNGRSWCRQLLAFLPLLPEGNKVQRNGWRSRKEEVRGNVGSRRDKKESNWSWGVYRTGS